MPPGSRSLREFPPGTRGGPGVHRLQSAEPHRIHRDRGCGGTRPVARAWVTLRVVVIPELQQPKIGLRLGQVTCPDGVLDLNDGLAGKVPREQRVETVDAASVRAPDGVHPDDLAVNEFDAIVFAEDSGLSHPVVLLDREQPGLGSNGHIAPCMVSEQRAANTTDTIYI